MSLDVERSMDFMETPGQSAELTIGPFVFWVATADGLRFGFGMKVLRWTLSWIVE